MKAEATIRRTMNMLYKIGRENQSKEQAFMACDMATALQWVIENTSWNPTSLLTEGDANGSNKKK